MKSKKINKLLGRKGKSNPENHGDFQVVNLSDKLNQTLNVFGRQNLNCLNDSCSGSENLGCTNGTCSGSHNLSCGKK